MAVPAAAMAARAAAAVAAEWWQEDIPTGKGGYAPRSEVLAQLGANPRAYRRERSRGDRALVAEVYSAPRVTHAAKLLPGLGVLPGFARPCARGKTLDLALPRQTLEAR